jgi:predicted dehydrogenase
MKAILVGLGNFGSHWYKQLRKHPSVSLIGVVEANPQLKESIDPDMPFYSSLEEAILTERPDFIVNVTPPHVHTRINELAFSHRLPVLCEKPISNELSDAQYIVSQAEKNGIPFMISENYRFFSPVRKVKELLDNGAIGELSSLHIEFARYHEVTVPYFGRLENALLEDVAIHHFDMVRYFTGREAKQVLARNSNPPGSWCTSNIHMTAWVELEGGTIVDYYGSMMAKGKQTEWYGDWRFEGSKGSITLMGKRVQLTREGHPDEMYEFADMGDVTSIDEFLASLKENREPQPSGKDYLKSQSLVHAAGLSCKLGKVLSVSGLS